MSSCQGDSGSRKPLNRKMKVRVTGSVKKGLFVEERNSLTQRSTMIYSKRVGQCRSMKKTRLEKK